MELIEKHKALIITFLLTGIMIFAMFSFHITKQSEFIAESFYEIEPQTIEELKKLKELEALEKSMSQTNKAFNEDKAFKEMMKNFKSMSANDFDKTTKKIEENTLDNPDEVMTSSTYNNSNGYTVNKDELSKFKKANDILDKRSEVKRAENSNANSTLTYSLRNRDLLDYDTPRYLCENSGKIVVNITVNASGMVVETYVNTSSTSENECLIDHALEYAKSVHFDASKNESQLGSITFYFKGKN